MNRLSTSEAFLLQFFGKTAAVLNNAPSSMQIATSAATRQGANGSASPFDLTKNNPWNSTSSQRPKPSFSLPTQTARPKPPLGSSANPSAGGGDGGLYSFLSPEFRPVAQGAARMLAPQLAGPVTNALGPVGLLALGDLAGNGGQNLNTLYNTFTNPGNRSNSPVIHFGPSRPAAPPQAVPSQSSSQPSASPPPQSSSQALPLATPADASPLPNDLAPSLQPPAEESLAPASWFRRGLTNAGNWLSESLGLPQHSAESIAANAAPAVVADSVGNAAAGRVFRRATVPAARAIPRGAARSLFRSLPIVSTVMGGLDQYGLDPTSDNFGNFGSRSRYGDFAVDYGRNLMAQENRPNFLPNSWSQAGTDAMAALQGLMAPDQWLAYRASRPQIRNMLQTEDARVRAENQALANGADMRSTDGAIGTPEQMYGALGPTAHQTSEQARRWRELNRHHYSTNQPLGSFEQRYGSSATSPSLFGQDPNAVAALGAGMR